MFNTHQQINLIKRRIFYKDQSGNLDLTKKKMHNMHLSLLQCSTRSCSVRIFFIDLVPSLSALAAINNPVSF